MGADPFEVDFGSCSDMRSLVRKALVRTVPMLQLYRRIRHCAFDASNVLNA